MSHDPAAASGDPRAPSSAARAAAEAALDVIRRYGRGELDGLDASRALVNDEDLRAIVPLRLLLEFIGVEARFPAEMDAERAAKLDPAELASLRADREELLAESGDELARACAALVAHLEAWQREHPSAGTNP